MTERDFRAIADALYADAGISLSDEKHPLVYSRLAKRLRALNLATFADYVDLIEGPDGADERRNMLASLTTNVTRFFREPHHFESLRAALVPLLAAARKGGKVRIWSAGCSTGQEPYSIALTVLEIDPGAASLDVRILASDIDPVVVSFARAGCYDDDHVSAIPENLKLKYFTSGGARGERSWTANEELKSLISFKELNLNGSWPMKGPFDVIFCRNVVIYFDEPTQQKLWLRFLQMLGPDGRLLIGHSERLSGPAAEQFSTDGITTYRRKANRI